MSSPGVALKRGICITTMNRTCNFYTMLHFVLTLNEREDI